MAEIEHTAENGLPPLGTARTCCGTVTGDTHRACPPTGHNEHGVAMCKCRKYGPPHAWEPGEACSPTRVLPPGQSDGR